MIEYLIISSFLLPALSVFLIVIFGNLPDLRDSVSIITSLLLLFIIITIYRSVDTSGSTEVVLIQFVDGLSISFHIEPLGLLFSMIASVLWVATNIYAIGYMRLNNEKNQTRFYGFFALSIAATMGIAFSANMLTLFLFYELLTLLTYPLVTHSGSQQARASGRIYLGLLLFTSIALQLTAMILVWSISHDLDFQPSGVLNNANPNLVFIIYILFLFGVGKAALMPFHRWLPAAMVAPTPVSALLHAVAVVKAGVFTIVKVTVYLFGLDTLQNIEFSQHLYLIPGFTIIVSSLIALQQDNLKKRLAYSTISQLSYIVLATLVLVPLSILAAGLHILAHAFAKITLFFAAGSIYSMSKKTHVSEMQGIAKCMPITMTAFLIGSLSMIGIPPTVGFISKWFILDSALLTQQFGVVIIIILSTLLNAAYYLPVCHQAFFKLPTEKDKYMIKESPPAITLPILFTMLMTVILFFYIDPFMQILQGLLVRHE